MTVSLGLTGNMGMGKSTAASMFKDLGCPVWDADATVHHIYSKDGAAVAPIHDMWPHVIASGAVDRQKLKEHLSKFPYDLAVLEKIVHQKLEQSRQEFRDHHSADPLIIFDIPLLFEKGLDRQMDATACVFVDAQTQLDRILDRGTMTHDQVRFYLSKQMPIEQKLERAQFRIDTSSFDLAARDVREIYQSLTSKNGALS